MKFREYTTSSGKKVLAGKDKESNEELVKQVESGEIVLHTKERGSPFVNIKGKADRKDIEEAAIFTAVYSQDWKKNHKDVAIHIFKGKDICKLQGMSTGTFGVKKFKEIKVKKKDIEKFVKLQNT